MLKYWFSNWYAGRLGTKSLLRMPLTCSPTANIEEIVLAESPLPYRHNAVATPSSTSMDCLILVVSRWTEGVSLSTIRRNVPLSTRKLVVKSPSFQFLRHVGQKSLEETLRQICRSIVFDKIYCIRTCWWAQAAAIMTSLVSFPPPRTGCGEERSTGMFSLPSILLLQSYMF